MINLNTKFSQSNKINKLLDLHKNSYILSLPSLFGIVLALVAIPVHLQINGKSDYGNYIFFHFIISFGLLFNMGINKIVAIEIAKKKIQYWNNKTKLKTFFKNNFFSLIVKFNFKFFLKWSL